MAKSRKASLIKQCRELGIDLPTKPSVADLEHLITSRSAGKGYIVRLLKPSNLDILNDFEKDTSYWLPSSKWAEDVIMTKRILIMTRCAQAEVPKGIRVMDIPEGW